MKRGGKVDESSETSQDDSAGDGRVVAPESDRGVICASILNCY